MQILEVREASQQRSLCGLENTASEGSAGFERISKIVDDLQQMGQEKSCYIAFSLWNTQ